MSLMSCVVCQVEMDTEGLVVETIEDEEQALQSRMELLKEALNLDNNDDDLSEADSDSSRISQVEER